MRQSPPAPVRFDEIAGQYERFHDRYLPPTGHSAQFAAQKADRIADWVRVFFPETGGLRVLDFGCGTGRIARQLVQETWCGALVGVDASRTTLDEAARAVGATDKEVRFVPALNALAETERFDVILVLNVLHHVALAERATVAAQLAARLTPHGFLAVWEQNPWNPLARYLVHICPFDKDAHILSCAAARRLFADAGLDCRQKAYINVVPPSWQRRWALFRALESGLAGAPTGTQYWAVFGKSAAKEDRL